MGIFGKKDRAPSTPADERPRTTYATSPTVAPSSPTVAPLYERFARTSTAAGSVLSSTSVAFPSTSAARSGSAYYGDLPPPPSNLFGQSTSSLVQTPGSDLSVDPFASQGSSSAMMRAERERARVPSGSRFASSAFGREVEDARRRDRVDSTKSPVTPARAGTMPLPTTTSPIAIPEVPRQRPALAVVTPVVQTKVRFSRYQV